MSSKESSIVRGGNNNGVVGRDTTTHHSDGSSTTVHQRAQDTLFGGVDAFEVTSVTENRGGVSSNRPANK
jgi:hypothetical protein